LYQIASISEKNSNKRRGRNQEASWNPQIRSLVNDVNDELGINLVCDF